jgi:taurine dioxygenase
VIRRVSARYSYAPKGGYADASAQVEVAHPAVRVYPETKRKCLFSNSVRFDDWSEEESTPLLKNRHARCTQSEFVCRSALRAGPLALWDNRVTQHFATNNYKSHRRHLQGLTLAGDRPFGIEALVA